MSLMTVVPPEDDVERWRQWQLANATSNRKAAAAARVVFTVMFVAVTGWVGWLLAS